MPFIQIKVDTGGRDFIPRLNTFITVNNGVKTHYGFGPGKSGKLFGKGVSIDLNKKASNKNLRHGNRQLFTGIYTKEVRQ